MIDVLLKLSFYLLGAGTGFCFKIIIDKILEK